MTQTPTPTGSPATPSRTPDVRRLRLVTHGDPAVTAAALPDLVTAVRNRGAEVVLGEEEVAKHPGLEGVAIDRPDEVDLILVLGGDGTMLRALGLAVDRPVACVGVNHGTFGFLTTMRASELLGRVPEILGGGLEILELPTVAVETPDGRFVAINDVFVTADQLGRMAVLEWAVNGVSLGQRGCDGILVSTPSGSTGYNPSAGGPVIEWGVDAATVTFVAPHSLDARPLILGRGHEVRVTSRTRDVGSRVVVDGHVLARLEQGAVATIQMAPERARLALLPDRPFLSRYRDKFGR